MEYLQRYNLTDSDINLFLETLEDRDIRELELNEERVSAILEYLLSIGITNLRDIICDRVYLLYDNLSFLQEKLEPYRDSSMISLINQNVMYLDTIGI